MIPTTQVLLVCVLFLCGLEEMVLSQNGHCAGNQCFAVFKVSKDFPGAQKSCSDGELFVFTVEDAEKTLTRLLSGLGGSYWLNSNNGTVEEAAAGLQNCPSISLTTGGSPTLLWKRCSDKLDGFLCQYPLGEPCDRLPAVGGAQVRFNTVMGFEVSDSETFPPGTIAVTEKVGAEYLDSKHVCYMNTWMPAPWSCEVMQGGCEHACTSTTTSTCICPAKQTLHPNNITCTKDPCADCEQECQQEGNSYVCKCNTGYRLAADQKSCVEVNECEEEDLCTGEGEECEIIQGKAECKCKDGFVEEGGECVDVSICEMCEHMCDNPSGVYRCYCREGHRVSAKDPTKCELYCPERDCLAKCIPDPELEKKDMQQCYCPDGYIVDIRNGTAFCTDINECELETQCEYKCENLFGGFKCLCDEGFKLQNDYECVPDDVKDGSSSAPSHPKPAPAHPPAVPSYIKAGSVLGITVFLLLCAALVCVLVRNMVKRCGRFDLSSFKHPDMDIFYLQQVTTDTYKRLSFDKQFKSDLQRQ